MKLTILLITSLVTMHLSRGEDPLYMISTSVQIKPGQLEQVLELFKETNAALVRDQEDWVKAHFSADISTDKVLVTAYWKNPESYKQFSRSDEFRKTMSRFQPYFMTRPEVLITRVLFEM